MLPDLRVCRDGGSDQQGGSEQPTFAAPTLPRKVALKFVQPLLLGSRFLFQFPGLVQTLEYRIRELWQLLQPGWCTALQALQYILW